MKLAKIIAVATLVLMVVGLFLGTGCGGDGGLSFGPYVVTVPADWDGFWHIGALNVGDKVKVSFEANNPVNCRVYPDDEGSSNVLNLTPDGPLYSGSGTFTAPRSVNYRVDFEHGPTEVRIKYTVYPAS